MRAIVVSEFGPPERLRVAEVPAPLPGPGEVLVETHAAPVNYVDMLVVGGTYQLRSASATASWRWPRPAAMPRRSQLPPTSATACPRA